MIYRPRSKTHKRRPVYNMMSTVEIIIGMLAWTFVCAISFWAIMLMLEEYTK